MKARFLSYALLFVFLIAPSSGHAGENKWTALGPNGGSFVSFAFHPAKDNLMFASSKNGLFRSLNGGKSWKRLEISGDSLVVRIHPRNPSAIIAADSSVYLSTDEGTSWQQISTLPFLKDRVSDMEFDPQDLNTLYAVTFRTGVFKSTDGGRTWLRKSTGLDLSGADGKSQIEIDPGNKKVLYALLLSRKVFKTTNGAETWTSSSNGLGFSTDRSLGSPTALAIDPSNPNKLFAGSTGSVFQTNNGGQQWSAVDCNCTVANIVVDPKNSQNVYVSGSQLAKSGDGGSSWQARPVHPFLATKTDGLGVHPKGNIVLLGGDGGGIFRSADSGKSWRVVNSRADAFIVRHLKAHPERPNEYFSQGDQHVFQSGNRGKSWSLIPAISQSIVRDFEIHPKNPNLMAAAGRFLLDGKLQTVAISTNGGRTWRFENPHAIFGHNTYDFEYSDVVALDPNDENAVYVGGSAARSNNSAAARSSDQGETWRPFDLPRFGFSATSAFAVDPNDGLVLFAAIDTQSGILDLGILYKSVDGGIRWRPSLGWSPNLSISPITSIAIDRRDSRVIYVSATRSSRYSALFKSTDGGTKWQDLVNSGKGLPSAGYNFVAVDPADSQTVYAGGTAGLFLSKNAGESWSAFDTNGLPKVEVFDFVIDPSDPDTFSIGTDRGVFSYTVAPETPQAPVIEQVSPGSAKVGEAIAINGRNFGSSQGTSKVLFGSVDAGTSESWSENSIVAQVPSGARTGLLRVEVASQRSNSFQFIVLSSTGNIEPASGPADGGTQVAIQAPSSFSGSTIFNVLFGAELARVDGFLSPNTILCTTPRGTGTVEVFIVTSVVSIEVGTFTYQ